MMDVIASQAPWLTCTARIKRTSTAPTTRIRRAWRIIVERSVQLARAASTTALHPDPGTGRLSCFASNDRLAALPDAAGALRGSASGPKRSHCLEGHFHVQESILLILQESLQKRTLRRPHRLEQRIAFADVLDRVRPLRCKRVSSVGWSLHDSVANDLLDTPKPLQGVCDGCLRLFFRGSFEELRPTNRCSKEDICSLKQHGERPRADGARRDPGACRTYRSACCLHAGAHVALQLVHALTLGEAVCAVGLRQMNSRGELCKPCITRGHRETCGTKRIEWPQNEAQGCCPQATKDKDKRIPACAAERMGRSAVPGKIKYQDDDRGGRQLICQYSCEGEEKAEQRRDQNRQPKRFHRE